MKKRNSKSTLFAIGLALLALFPVNCMARISKTVTITKEELMNKIKGGWAGQTIGVTWTKPSENVFQSSVIPDYVQYEWGPQIVNRFMHNDDIYMDMTFMEVIEREGIDASAEAHAKEMANADYMLWHANQTARYNVLNGIMPPDSGHWKYNIHSDCIDAQIEADFAGIMSPGMINAATEITDTVHHIMNSGDAYYGAAFVAGMYTQAFVSDDMDFVVTEALKTIPEKSEFYKAMKQTIKWCKQYEDWRDAWFQVQKQDWSKTMICPQGVFLPFNLDAITNATYIVIGLYYGDMDFYKTMDIAMRCGDDSDCNPSNAAGILGTMIGYSNIPDYWLKPLQQYEDVDLRYTKTSMNRAYAVSFKHALQNIERNGGKVRGDHVVIKYQTPVELPYEEANPGIYPVKRHNWQKDKRGRLVQQFTKPLKFTGTGLSISGIVHYEGNCNTRGSDYVGELEVYIDGKLDAVRKLPANFHSRAQEFYINMELPKAEHELKLKWRNPDDKVEIHVWNVIIYSDEPVVHNHQ